MISFIVTVRAGSSTISPSRTRSYARLPSTLIAETELGRCEISPTIAAKPDEIWASDISKIFSGGAFFTISPSRSSVTVDEPSRIVPM